MLRKPRTKRRTSAGIVVSAMALLAAPAAGAEQRALELLSDGSAGLDPNAQVLFGGASDDGSLIFFVTAERMAAGYTDTVADVYERSPAGLTLVSDGAGGQDANDGVEFSGASSDGGRVFFETRERRAPTARASTSRRHRSRPG